MPNTSSAKKALRQNQKRRLANRTQRSSLRTTVKKVRIAAEGTDPAVTQAALREATKSLDKAAAKNLIHKNTAARMKSRLAKFVQAKSQQAVSAESASTEE